MIPKKKRLNSPKYRAWVQEKPCLVGNKDCSDPETVVPHHIFGGHGRKDDKEAVPLCHTHHDYSGPESVHRLLKDKFEKKHSINMVKEAKMLYNQYLKEGR